MVGIETHLPQILPVGDSSRCPEAEQKRAQAEQKRALDTLKRNFSDLKLEVKVSCCSCLGFRVQGLGFRGSGFRV